MDTTMRLSPIARNIASIAQTCRRLLDQLKLDAATMAHNEVIGQLRDNVDSLNIDFIMEILALIGDEPALISNRNHGFSLINYSWTEAEHDGTQFVAHVRNDDWHLEIRDAIKSYLSTAKLLK